MARDSLKSGATFGTRNGLPPKTVVPDTFPVEPRFRLATWQIGLALLAILALSQAAVFASARSFGMVIDAYAVVAIGGLVTSIIKFLVLGFILVVAVRAVGGHWSPVEVLSAFLILPAVTLLSRASMLASSFVFDSVDRPFVTRDHALLGYLLDGINWVLLAPTAHSLILVFAVVFAARIGGKLGWPSATVAGLSVAACSFAMGYVLYAGMAPADAVSLALLDMLRI